MFLVPCVISAGEANISCFYAYAFLYVLNIAFGLDAHMLLHRHTCFPEYTWIFNIFKYW